MIAISRWVLALLLGALLIGLGYANRVSLALWLVNRLATNTEQVGDNLPYRPDAAPQQTLNIYAPQDLPQDPERDANASWQRQRPRPVVVFFYGGCWGACTRFYKADYRFVAEALTEAGYVVVIPDYRLYPEVQFPAIMADASAAVTWVTDNIGDYGGDPAQLFLMGHSAGAQMAALLTLNQTAYLQTPTYESIQGFIGLAGPYDFLPFDQAYQPILFGPEENYPASQPINFVTGDEPPLLLLYGNADSVVYPRNIENLSEKVTQFGGEVEVHRYDGIDHAGLVGALSGLLRDRQPVYADILKFLSQHSSNSRDEFAQPYSQPLYPAQ